MVHKMKAFWSGLLCIAVLAAILAGCAGSADPSSSANSSGSSAGQSSADSSDSAPSESSALLSSETSDAANETGSVEYPIVIQHAFGETVIESKPDRVATIQWGNQDVVLALGVVPVGFSAANYGVEDDSGLLPWTKDRLTELGEENPNVFQDTDGLDFEAISDCKPDVILAAYSGITQEDYDILTQIAPVVAYQTTPWMTQWRELVTYTALGMGMPQEGEQLIADTEALIAEKTAAYPQIAGKTVTWVNFNATDLSKLHIYTPEDPRGAFLYELGLTYPQSVIDAIDDPESYSASFSAENAAPLHEADILVGYGTEDVLEAVKADQVLGKIPAVQKGAVVVIPGNTSLGAAGNPNPLSIEHTIDEYLALIVEALDKSDAE